MTSNKVKLILVYEDLQFGVLLPKNVSYSNLVRYLMNKFKVDEGRQVSLSYKIGSMSLNITNDTDVSYFLNDVCRVDLTRLVIIVSDQKNVFSPNSSRMPLDPHLQPAMFPTPHFTHQWKMNNPLLNVPRPPHAPLIDNDKEHNVSMRRGYTFDDKEECIFEIGKKCLTEGYECKVLRSCTVRYAVECVKPDCLWYIFARRIKKTTKWRITNINDCHDCSKTQFNRYHRNVTSKLLSRLLIPKVRDVKRLYKPKDVATDLNLEWNVYISYKKAWRGRHLALASTQGCPIQSFVQLPYYCHNLEKQNEGTVTHIETDDDCRFKMCFIAFGVAIKSFLCYMRPLIIIDAAHLKGKYLGTNLVACGMDGNNQIIPLATGVTQSESGESWTWFMRKLKDCIGEVPNLAIISDRHYAIELACNTVFPNSFHGYCCRHLMMNCGMGSETCKELYWKTCKAYTTEDFDKLMTDIQASRPEAHRKLVLAGVEKWSRAKCPAHRYNYMTSNSVESINAQSKDVRRIPVTSLMDWFRDLLQTWYCDRRHKYEDTPDDELTPWATNKIRYRWLKSSSWTVKAILRYYTYQVRDNKKIQIVDLNIGECTCRRWQLSGIPCGHVCAVARVEGVDSVSKFAKPWFFNKTLKATYEGLFFPVVDVCSWEVPSDIQRVLPPDMGFKQPGRPRNRDRIRSQGEGPLLTRCGRCGVLGHNRSRCNVPLPSIENIVTRRIDSTMEGESSQTNNSRVEPTQPVATQHMENQTQGVYIPQYEVQDQYFMYQHNPDTTNTGMNGLSQLATPNNLFS